MTPWFGTGVFFAWIAVFVAIAVAKHRQTHPRPVKVRSGTMKPVKTEIKPLVLQDDNGATVKPAKPARTKAANPSAEPVTAEPVTVTHTTWEPARPQVAAPLARVEVEQVPVLQDDSGTPVSWRTDGTYRWRADR